MNMGFPLPASSLPSTSHTRSCTSKPPRGRLGHASNDDLLSACLRHFAGTAARNTALGVGNGCWGLAMLARAEIPFFADYESPHSISHALVQATMEAGVGQLFRLLEVQGRGGPVVSLLSPWVAGSVHESTGTACGETNALVITNH